MLFDRFRPGATIGTQRFETSGLLAEWNALFSSPPEAPLYLPAGLLVAILMRGYTAIVAHRPPGNVHAAQALHWGAPAGLDATLLVRLRCQDAVLRHERRWLTLAATIENEATGETHLAGQLKMLWAA